GQPSIRDAREDHVHGSPLRVSARGRASAVTAHHVNVGRPEVSNGGVHQLEQPRVDVALRAIAVSECLARKREIVLTKGSVPRIRGQLEALATPDGSEDERGWLRRPPPADDLARSRTMPPSHHLAIAGALAR